MQKQEKKSLGRLISDLLVEALSRRQAGMVSEDLELRWISKPMEPMINLQDKDALYAKMDKSDPPVES